MSIEALVADGLRRELEAVQPAPGAWRALRERLADQAPVQLWHRVWDHGVSRRQFLRVAAAVAGGVLVPGLPAPLAAPAKGPATPPPPGTHFDGAIILRDPGGGIRGEAAFGGQRIHKHAGGATAWMRLHLPGVRLGAGEALVVATLTGQAVSVAARVRLLPAAEVGQPASRPRGAEVTVRGVTVSVLSAALGGDPAVVRMGASGVGGYAMIGSRMGTRGRGGELVLRDADGREYLEEISLHPTSHGSALFDDVVHFPKLPSDARGLELIVSTVSVHEREGEAVVDVPMDSLRPNVRKPLSSELRLGRYPLRVTGVEPVPADQGTVELDGRPSLALYLDLATRSTAGCCSTPPWSWWTASSSAGTSAGGRAG
jgi:hypothetical protein